VQKLWKRDAAACDWLILGKPRKYFMDFIDWCHHVLGILEKEKFNQDLYTDKISRIIFPKEITQQPDFHNSNILRGVEQTLKFLLEAELIEEDSWGNWKITLSGRKVLIDPINSWTKICGEELDSEEETLVKLVNEHSPQIEDNPVHGWLKPVEADQILSTFNILRATETEEQFNNLEKYIVNLPQSLKERNFLQVFEQGGYNTTELKPTYEGLVWDIKRGFTIESKLIDELVKEWETTNVDFKQEIGLGTNRQRARFARNVLGLATTKSSGKRYMIIGFDDKTREYLAPPDTSITQEIMEQHLANLTDPFVNISYEIVDCKQGKVGKLEVIREPEKLPYRAKKDVIVDEKGKKGLEKDKIYVRHGSHTESPSDVELKALIEEGKRARGEI